ncbi:APC family permease [Bifidobacterium leontopitheci]|nr:APC family permease [Bifidobacterium leontopitheci]
MPSRNSTAVPRNPAASPHDSNTPPRRPSPAASPRGLGAASLTALAAGNIIGLGVLSLAGIGIGITGTGLWIAALAGGLAAALALAPQLLVSAAADWPGGQYEQVATLLPRTAGGIVAYILCFLVFDVTAYALSAAELLGLPPLVTRLVAIVLVAAVLLLHMVGARAAAATQLVMTAVLALALGVAVAALAPHVRLGYLTADTFLGSPAVFAFAAVYMAFMMNGAAVAANYSSVTRAPRRTVPRAMAAALLIVVVLYAAVCLVDAGVLPIGRVANQDLSVTLAAFLPAPAVTALTVAVSAFALLTSLNAVVGWIAYPVAAAAVDGWLPRELAARSPRTGAPTLLLAVLLIVAEVPLIAGVPAKTVSSSVTILVVLVQLLVAVAGLRLALSGGVGGDADGRTDDAGVSAASARAAHGRRDVVGDDVADDDVTDDDVAGDDVAGDDAAGDDVAGDAASIRPLRRSSPGRRGAVDDGAVVDGATDAAAVVRRDDDDAPVWLVRVPRAVQVAACVAAIVVDVLLVAWLLYTMNRLLIVGNLVLLAVAVISASVVRALRGSTATTDTRS